MDFERYRVPASVREGVVIELPGTSEAQFLVALPSEHNRAYSAAVQRATPITLDDDDRPDFSKVDYVSWQSARIEAFLQHCILRMPDGLTPEALRGDYYPGLVALFRCAEDLASDENDRAKAATKKSRA